MFLPSLSLSRSLYFLDLLQRNNKTPVSDSQQHINVLRGLSLQLQHIVYQENQKCWGKPLGSSNLWQEHVETIKRIQQLANQIEIKEVSQRVIETSFF